MSALYLIFKVLTDCG